ncbi:hypothetical protein E2R52_14025 [Pantoea ananatis]|nr:hypothetical protein E2R52_14025 [Pantoea ananatis]
MSGNWLHFLSNCLNLASIAPYSKTCVGCGQKFHAFRAMYSAHNFHAEAFKTRFVFLFLYTLTYQFRPRCIVNDCSGSMK